MEIEAVTRLPAALGMNEKHFSLRDEFVNRLRGILKRDDLEMKNYAISENWNGCATETLVLETDDMTLNLQLTAKKS